MSKRHPRRISRRAAEQLLSGDGGPDAAHGRLAGVLAAAAGPARESELGGEQAAVAAFEAHHLVSATTSRRGQMIKSPLAKLLTAKVIAASVAVFATGGVALAASTGVLTGSRPGHEPGSNSLSPGQASVSVSASASASVSVSALASSAPSVSTPVSPSTAPTSPVRIPGTAVGLCRALAAQVSHSASGTAGLEQALASPMLARLAGTKEYSSLVVTVQAATNVPDYCALLLQLAALPQPSDLAQLPASVLSSTLARLPAGPLARVLTELPGPALAQVLTALPAHGLAQVVTRLRVPVLTRLLGELPTPVATKVLSRLPAGVLSRLPGSLLSRLGLSGLSGL